MTAKRYFKRMWEEEYYIFDLNTISESDFEEKLEYQGYKAFEDSMTGEEVTDRLNKYNKEYLDCHNDVLRLEKENEQLKSDNNRLINETAKVVAEHQRKVLELIDKRINLLENDYKKAVKSGMLSNSVYGEIELLEELKKELQDD